MRHSILLMLLVGIIFNFTIPIDLSELSDDMANNEPYGNGWQCMVMDELSLGIRVVPDFWTFLLEFVQGIHIVFNLEHLTILWLVYDEPVPVFLHRVTGPVMVWRRRARLYRYVYTMPRLLCFILLGLMIGLSFAPYSRFQGFPSVQMDLTQPMTTFICVGYFYSTHALIMMLLLLSGDVETNPGPANNPFIDDEAGGSGTSDEEISDDVSKLDDLFIDDSAMYVDFTPYFDLDEISLSSGNSCSGSDSETEHRRERGSRFNARDRKRKSRAKNEVGSKKRSMTEINADRRKKYNDSMEQDLLREMKNKHMRTYREKKKAEKRTLAECSQDVEVAQSNKNPQISDPTNPPLKRVCMSVMSKDNADCDGNTGILSKDLQFDSLIGDSGYGSIPNTSKTGTAPPKTLKKVKRTKKCKNVVKEFHEAMNCYPEYACKHCSKLCYLQGVVKLPNTDDWICKRCKTYESKGKFSPVNEEKMLLNPGSLPATLVPNPTEARMVSQRIPCMKIRLLPAGGQRGISGNVINVPITLKDTCLTLPRANEDLGIMNVRIKRNINHRSVIVQDTVDPTKVFRLLQYFQENNPKYKDVVLTNTWVAENYHDNQELFNASLTDNPFIICRSIVEEIVTSIGAEGTYSALPYENCIQVEDIAQTMTDEIFKKTPILDFAPGQNETPISLIGDEDLEPLAFPHHFPLGKGHFYDDERALGIKSKELPKLTLKHYCEHRLLNKDRRFAQDPAYIFTMQACVERTSIYQSVNTHMRKSTKCDEDGTELSAGVLTSMSEGGLRNLIDSLKFMKDIKASPAYWQRVKSDAFGMVNQLGMFTWFVTFSFNDLVYSIPAILKLQGIEVTDDLLNNISWFEKHRILKDDPVTAVRTFDRYLHKILSILLDRGKLLGAIDAHFGRVEFGDRGSPHLHMMLKCKDAPQLGVDSLEKVIAYIDQHVTTENPSLEEDACLHELVKLQTHRHTKTCTKYSENSGGSCRFHFPRKVTAKTFIIGTESHEGMDDGQVKSGLRNSGRKQKVEYKRSLGNEYVNPYNENLLRATRSNMDIQFVTSMWDMVNYVLAYATKTEKAVCDKMKDVLKEIDDPVNIDTRTKLKRLGNVFINTRSVSQQESIYRTLPYSMSVSKPEVIFVPSNQAKFRHGMLKSKHQLQALHSDSTDVFNKGLIDRYPHRPDSLNEMSLMEFAVHYKTFYSYEKENDNNKERIIVLKKEELGRMIKRLSPVVVRTHCPSRKTDPEGYYYSKICMYFPWRSESEIEGHYDNLEDSFMYKAEVIKSNMSRFETIDSDTMEDIVDEVKQSIKDRLDVEDACKSHSDKLDNRFALLHPRPGLKDPDDKVNFKITYVEPDISKEEYNTRVNSLNLKQQGVFNLVREHVNQVASGKSVRQLVHFISGAGGVGKTFLISVLRACINNTLGGTALKPYVAVTATTGTAAALVEGTTAHQLLQLDTQRGGYISNQKPLSSSKCQTMIDGLFGNLQYLIIDEVSMLGNTVLNHIHVRLNQLKGMNGQHDYFGGVNILFFGDFYQIPPVQQSKIFDPRGPAKLSVNLWKDLVTFSELTEIVRSKGDSQFTEICHRLRTGNQTANDMDVLRSRVIDVLPPVTDMLNDLVLYTTNKQCREHNTKCIEFLRTKTRCITVTACDRFTNEAFNGNPFGGDTKRNASSHAAADVNKTAGLPQAITIGVGARVMIRVNIDVSEKLCNGVCGTVRLISFTGTTDHNSTDKVTAKVVKEVHIEFDNVKVGVLSKHACGPKCTPDCPLRSTVPIKPVEKQFQSSVHGSRNAYVSRYQLPFVLCWATTAHKCQGMTLQRAYIDLTGRFWKAGMAYTAISRLTNLSGLHLLGFQESNIKVDPVITAEYERLRSLPEFSFNSVQPSNSVPLPNIVQTITSTSNLCAVVVDFLPCVESVDISCHLNILGYKVRTIRHQAQKGFSCGYIAARVISKMISMPDCFDMNVCYNDCVFGGEVTNNMISIANTKLNIQPINTPALLFGGQCLELISVYLSEYYNIDVNANELYMNYNVDDAISLSTFKKRVDDHVIQRINKSGAGDTLVKN
eukprot:sb/3460564/